MTGFTEPLHVATQIHGWMTEPELLWLGFQAERCRTVIEVGSYMGRSTKMMALCTRGRVYSVDNLKGVRHEGQRLDEMFRDNLAPELETGKVFVVRSPSVDAARRMRGGMQADMIFIDAGHDYPEPLEDIKAWLPILKPDGLLCGHDWGLPGVYQSLQECGHPWEIVVDGIWKLRLEET